MSLAPMDDYGGALCPFEVRLTVKEMQWLLAAIELAVDVAPEGWDRYPRLANLLEMESLEFIGRMLAAFSAAYERGRPC
jgi:hypothetical protein